MGIKRGQRVKIVEYIILSVIVSLRSFVSLAWCNQRKILIDVVASVLNFLIVSIGPSYLAAIFICSIHKQTILLSCSLCSLADILNIC